MFSKRLDQEELNGLMKFIGKEKEFLESVAAGDITKGYVRLLRKASYDVLKKSTSMKIIVTYTTELVFNGPSDETFLGKNAEKDKDYVFEKEFKWA